MNSTKSELREMLETVAHDVEHNWTTFSQLIKNEESGILKGILLAFSPLAAPSSWLEATTVKRHIRSQLKALLENLPE